MTAVSNKHAPFEKMAARIIKNSDEQFGGAFVVVPPNGDPLECVILSPLSNTTEAHFWASLQAAVSAQLELINERERNGAFRR